MTRIGIAIAARCNFCSKQKPEHKVHRLSNNQVICEYCLDWHFHALEFLSGATPRGCQQCQKPWDALYEAAPVEVRMYVVPKDGIYQLLCTQCARPYVGKRADLYRGTEFGNALKIL